jgi:hypothetical protein
VADGLGLLEIGDFVDGASAATGGEAAEAFGAREGRGSGGLSFNNGRGLVWKGSLESCQRRGGVAVEQGQVRRWLKRRARRLTAQSSW